MSSPCTRCRCQAPCGHGPAALGLAPSGRRHVATKVVAEPLGHSGRFLSLRPRPPPISKSKSLELDRPEFRPTLPGLRRQLVAMPDRASSRRSSSDVPPKTPYPRWRPWHSPPGTGSAPNKRCRRLWPHLFELVPAAHMSQSGKNNSGGRRARPLTTRRRGAHCGRDQVSAPGLATKPAVGLGVWDGATASLGISDGPLAPRICSS